MKYVNSLKGLHVLKTLHGTKKSSIPRVHNSTYLDSYMLEKEKERLLKEYERLCMRRDVIKKRLEEIHLEMNKLKDIEAAIRASDNENSSGRTFNQKDGVKKDWKKMSLNY